MKLLYRYTVIFLNAAIVCITLLGWLFSAMENGSFLTISSVATIFIAGLNWHVAYFLNSQKLLKVAMALTFLPMLLGLWVVGDGLMKGSVLDGSVLANVAFFLFFALSFSFFLTKLDKKTK
jgi:hypothetical protein